MVDRSPDAAMEEGFNRAAGTYDFEMDGNLAMQYMRRASVQTLLAQFRPGHLVLELGCGTGEEALLLARHGVRVLAIDLSPEMVSIASDKAAAAGLSDQVQFQALPLSELGRLVDGRGPASFDGVYSSFGPLNGEPHLAGVSAALSALVRPGGICVLGVMNRFYLLETVWFLLHAQPRQAFRRWCGRAMATVSPDLPHRVPTWYWSRRALVRAFSGFEVVHTRALPLLLPPPYLAHLWHRFPRAIHTLQRWEEQWAGRWPGSGLGDHVLLVLRRAQNC